MNSSLVLDECPAVALDHFDAPLLKNHLQVNQTLPNMTCLYSLRFYLQNWILDDDRSGGSRQEQVNTISEKEFTICEFYKVFQEFFESLF